MTFTRRGPRDCVSPAEVMPRRSLLLGLIAAGGLAAGCSSASDSTTSAGGLYPPSSATSPTVSPSTTGDRRSSRVLLAYFSRAGENYYYGGLRTLHAGNTQVLAESIRDRIGCDLYKIEAADPYPDRYDATVARNVDEQTADARPEISGQLPYLNGYNVVVLASPIWNVRPPMIMKSFTEPLDFTGKTVHPVVTYAVSGLGNAEREYRQSCRGATLAQALAVQGERVTTSRRDIETWLRANGLAT